MKNYKFFWVLRQLRAFLILLAIFPGCYDLAIASGGEESRLSMLGDFLDAKSSSNNKPVVITHKAVSSILAGDIQPENLVWHEFGLAMLAGDGALDPNFVSMLFDKNKDAMSNYKEFKYKMTVEAYEMSPSLFLYLFDQCGLRTNNKIEQENFTITVHSSKSLAVSEYCSFLGLVFAAHGIEISYELVDGVGELFFEKY